MNLPRATLDRATWSWIVTPLLAVSAGGILALSGHPVGVVILVAAVAAYLMFTIVSVLEPLVLVTGLLLIFEVLPPFYFSVLGETPVYVSFFALPVVLVVVVMRLADIRWKWDPIVIGLLVFLAALALSIPFAFWFSGTNTGLNSLSRWLLLSHTALIYFLIRGCRPGLAVSALYCRKSSVDATILARSQTAPTAGHSGRTELPIFRLLLIGAVASAAYGIVDFLWPIPLAHPAADQFIWLEGAVLRRAQGVFYESSNYANFCGFFLTITAAAFLAHRERLLGVSRHLLIVFISVLSLAVLLAFSRSTWASVLTALFASVTVGRFVRLPRGVAVFAAVLIPLCLLWNFSPELWDYFVSGRMGRLFEIVDDPNSATSGRVDTWVHVLGILRDNPQYLFFGIGYKTLNLTRLFHGELIVDNGYLSLLLETGVAGLAGFLLWSFAILKTFFRLAHSVHEAPAFWGTVLFSIWCGELVQLLAADAYTYWRNICVFTALMALTLNLADQVEQSRGRA